jgi:hypothetical protein
VQADTAAPEIAGLVARLDELEAELGRLRGAVGSPAAAQSRPQWQEPEVQHETRTAAPVVHAEPARGWGEIEVEDAGVTIGWNPPPEPAPQVVEEPTRPARELFLDDDTFGGVDGYVEVASEPEAGQQEARRMPDPFAPQSLLPSGLADAQATDAPAPEASQSKPAVTPPVRGTAQRGTPATPSAPPRGQVSTEPTSVDDSMRFPAFVGGPAKSAQGRVELTYENQDPDEVVELPASALLFENNAGNDDGQAPSEEAVFDLRAFGATEFDQ